MSALGDKNIQIIAQQQQQTRNSSKVQVPFLFDLSPKRQGEEKEAAWGKEEIVDSRDGEFQA